MPLHTPGALRQKARVLESRTVRDYKIPAYGVKSCLI
jgi:hypothetical protein